MSTFAPSAMFVHNAMGTRSMTGPRCSRVEDLSASKRIAESHRIASHRITVRFRGQRLKAPECYGRQDSARGGRGGGGGRG
eukprot:CAMPEP_0198217846 /NCGR_PEP_ID=MMETSP1445-20131203/66119_1 /TAXON_ID=36898 /ORGANISM="Pyramimonas sp., Strain CCMP2087" /LENGTH=80 /DNA_ID=CAMNT_0043894675 /DNA_START=87 /DNA_END=326 /DNA_ORIENTATION=+